MSRVRPGGVEGDKDTQYRGDYSLLSLVNKRRRREVI